jgi:hypothetical protein
MTGTLSGWLMMLMLMRPRTRAACAGPTSTYQPISGTPGGGPVGANHPLPVESSSADGHDICHVIHSLAQGLAKS